jgi:Sec7-like guanine-nucleotide exchange factor
VNNYKQLDLFERVYFQHCDFYCALELYMCTISLGKVYRNCKFQLVEYANSQKLQKNAKSFSQRSRSSLSESWPSLSESVHAANEQVAQYT